MLSVHRRVPADQAMLSRFHHEEECVPQARWAFDKSIYVLHIHGRPSRRAIYYTTAAVLVFALYFVDNHVLGENKTTKTKLPQYEKYTVV